MSALIEDRYLLAERCFPKIDIFEQQATVGGAWNYSELNPECKIQVPQINPFQPRDRPFWTAPSDEEPVPVFSSPMYDRLETNIPKDLMGYSDQRFPPECQLFPHRDTVTAYLSTYAEEVKSLIRFKTQVLDVRSEISSSGNDVWNVRYMDLVSSEKFAETYDAVAVCSGHYTVPHLPAVSGIEEWNKAYPGLISHSKFYRRPENLRNKKVIIVGNAASGTDIASQVSLYSKSPLLVSSRSESFLFSAADDKEDVSEIMEFIAPSEAERAVRFADGRVEAKIDAILYCTGYLYSYPFLSSLQERLLSNGFRVQHTYQHIFYIDHPSLAFLAVPMRVLPFPLSEAQAAVMARVWSSRLYLPAIEAMYNWEQTVANDKGTGKGFHVLNFPEDFDYHNRLYDWADTVDRNIGKLPHRWNQKERWTRKRFAAIKKAFADRGELRHQVQTTEDLGFQYNDCLEDD
ncbi:monooxygenase [Ptychographa xylographoides]|nr:monooxygenase [Ptychographa xylographoides]